MEHYYVISGDEFGLVLSTKKNFRHYDRGGSEREFQNRIKESNYLVHVWMFVDMFGRETILKQSDNF